MTLMGFRILYGKDGFSTIIKWPTKEVTDVKTVAVTEIGVSKTSHRIVSNRSSPV